METAHEELAFTGEVIIGMVSVLGNLVPPVYPVFNECPGHPLHIPQALQVHDTFSHGLNILIQPCCQLFDEGRARMMNVI